MVVTPLGRLIVVFTGFLVITKLPEPFGWSIALLLLLLLAVRLIVLARRVRDFRAEGRRLDARIAAAVREDRRR